MRGGSLRRFKVYVPNEQGGGGLMRWQTPHPMPHRLLLDPGVILK